VFSVYSSLFFKGKDPSSCGVCLNKFYNKIISEGLQIIEFMENQTLVLARKLKYVRQENKNFSQDNLSDEKAIEMLKKGWMSKKDFKALPKGYTAPKEKKEEVKEVKK
jgi:hypothetical protein